MDIVIAIKGFTTLRMTVLIAFLAKLEMMENATSLVSIDKLFITENVSIVLKIAVPVIDS
jgi:hypothetical protein